MPLKGVQGVGEHIGPLGRRKDRKVADFVQSFGMEPHLPAERMRQHLAAQTDPQKWLARLERQRDPVKLNAQKWVLFAFVDPHWPTEDDDGRMLVHGRRQGIALTGTPNIQGVPFLTQNPPHSSRARAFLVKNDKYAVHIRRK